MINTTRYATFLVRLLTVAHLVRSIAGSFLNLYSDSQCQQLVARVAGTKDCTLLNESFGSFQAASIDIGCSVTVYGANNPFCGTSDRWLVTGCHANTSINQFTIDCVGSESTPTGGVIDSTDTNTTNISTANSTSQTSSEHSKPGLTTDQNIAIGLGVPGAVAGICTIIWGLRASLRRRANQARRANKTNQAKRAASKNPGLP